MTDQWAILELLGHRRLAGLISECEIAGAGFLRIDVMDPDGGFKATQYYAPGSVYCLTPTTEEAVRAEVEMRKARPSLSPWTGAAADREYAEAVADPYGDDRSHEDDEDDADPPGSFEPPEPVGETWR